MISYLLKEPYVLEQKELKKPVPGDCDVLIRVRYVGICGSDLHLYKGTYNAPHSYPMRFGHEWAGVVEAVGQKVTKVSPGDWVTGDCSKFCGHCAFCAVDRNLCSHIEKFGITIDGATSEYILRNEMYVYKAPDDIRPELLCLSEPVAVAAHLLKKIHRIIPEGSADKRVLVLGGGVIGMSALMLLIHMEKCRQAELYDLAHSRTEVARSEGAVIPEKEELEASRQGADYASMYAAAKYDIVLETTGAAPVFANALNLVKPGGVLGCVGMIARAEIQQKLIVTKALTVLGSIGGTGDFPQAMEFLNRYPDAAAKLISHYYPMQEAPRAFKTAEVPEGTMKVVLAL